MAGGRRRVKDGNGDTKLDRMMLTCSRAYRNGGRSCIKKEPRSCFHERGIYLATTYSHKTYRLTTIGAEAFHFRVRNGTGWFHFALVTREGLFSKRARALVAFL